MGHPVVKGRKVYFSVLCQKKVSRQRRKSNIIIHTILSIISSELSSECNAVNDAPQ